LAQNRCLKSRERWIWAALVVVLAVLNAFQFWMGPALTESSPAEIDAQAQEPVESGSRSQIDQPLIWEPQQALSDYQRRQFQRRGLNNPEAEIRADLLGKPHLIPLEPVLGGTMFFLPDSVQVLSDRWVMASYEDGHVQGRALFEYQVSSQGEISWRLLAAADN